MRHKKLRVVIENSTDIEQYNVTESISIEEKIQQMVLNNEPISDATNLYYTERSEGVRPEMDIRTDRFDIALEKMDYVSKTHIAKRKERLEKQKAAKQPKSPEDESTQATE